MSKRAIVGLWTITWLLTPLGALAQGLDITNPAPSPARDPGASLPRNRPPTPELPAFVSPLSKETAGGRAGVAGWIAPSPSVGARAVADPAGSGSLGVGIAIEWGGSAPPRAHN